MLTHQQARHIAEEALEEIIVGSSIDDLTIIDNEISHSPFSFTFNFYFIQQFFQQLSAFASLGSEAQLALAASLELIDRTKSEYLVAEGKTCRYLYFLQQGSLRGCYTLDGKEITHWFAFEGDFVTSFHSFITQQPAVENIQALEDSTLYRISKNSLNVLMATYHEIETLVRIAYEKYYIRLEERFVNAHFKTATQRYQDLLQRAPHILEKVPLGHIASYLGISPETLSRVRNRY